MARLASGAALFTAGHQGAAKVVVAVPAKDEADYIGACLTALNEQQRPPDVVVLLLNGVSDETESIARAMGPALRFRLDIVARGLPPEEASAGHARRLAMALAAEQAGPDGILLTTDADGVVPPDWIARNLAALAQGADVVCGRAVLDPRDAAAIPAHLHDDDAREQRLIGLLDEMAWMLDPEPNDPLPRHAEASGASIAVTVSAFHRVRGIPAIRSSEDRAFIRALWLIDANIRHDPLIQVTVSGRIHGQAEGGMADAIRRRMIQQDEFTDEQVEPAVDAFRRYNLRHRARRAWSQALAHPGLCRDLALPALVVAEALAHPCFGAAWTALEAASPTLGRRRVRFTELAAEIAVADILLRRVPALELMAAD